MPSPAQYGRPSGGAGGQAAPATQQQVQAYRSLLISTIQEKNLQIFYPPERLDRVVQTLAAEAPGKLARLIHEWNVPMEVATDVMKLALFDVILYVDDSGSIEFEEKGLRKDQLKQILGIVATAASTFDEDGISVRFMNSSEKGDGIRNAEDVNRLVSRVRFSGLTPLGTNLRSKVVEPMVIQPARANRLEKPVLVITITDGQPAGEPHGTIRDVILEAVEATSRPRTQYGIGSVSFQFAQVGTDQRAREFLSDLDEDPQIGHLIDCTSSEFANPLRYFSTDPMLQTLRLSRMKCLVLTHLCISPESFGYVPHPLHLTFAHIFSALNSCSAPSTHPMTPKTNERALAGADLKAQSANMKAVEGIPKDLHQASTVLRRGLLKTSTRTARLMVHHPNRTKASTDLPQALPRASANMVHHLVLRLMARRLDTNNRETHPIQAEVVIRSDIMGHCRD